MNENPPKRKRHDDPSFRWVFSWRRNYRRRWQLLLAASVVLLIMSLLLATLRVRVLPPPVTLNRSGNLVIVSDTPENQEWLEKIAQKTPFPDISRIENTRSIEALSKNLLLPSAGELAITAPTRREVILPENDAIFEQLAVFPPLDHIEEKTLPEATNTNSQLLPRIVWLSPLRSSFSVDIPDYIGPLTPTSGVRYMLEVNPQGNIQQCIPSLKESTKRLPSLENWLKQCRFDPASRISGWIACEIIWEPAP
ncbi:MAG: hypothetical protein CAK88_12295 [Verrucomicrobiia bacterium AMD-G2]|nr:MAG: hypothetical protein CAK88_12295 [Verrucomicrobiae bacterium AMD-G2]